MDRRAFVSLGPGLGLPGPFIDLHSTSFAEEFDLYWDRTRIYTLEFVDAMPLEGWEFRPVPEVRSYAEQLIHIGQANFTFAGAIRGGPVPDFPDFAAVESTPVGVRPVLDRSFQVMRDAVLERTDAELDERVPWQRRRGVERSHAKRGVALTAWHHTAHHRGQCVIYLRLNGIVPPVYVD